MCLVANGLDGDGPQLEIFAQSFSSFYSTCVSVKAEARSKWINVTRNRGHFEPAKALRLAAYHITEQNKTIGMV